MWRIVPPAILHGHWSRPTAVGKLVWVSTMVESLPDERDVFLFNGPMQWPRSIQGDLALPQNRVGNAVALLADEGEGEQIGSLVDRSSNLEQQLVRESHKHRHDGWWPRMSGLGRHNRWDGRSNERCSPRGLERQDTRLRTCSAFHTLNHIGCNS
uniref:Uncharacterized protein n=1 Tax=Bionectria ochroleuca TaxID=29856 RepID=A0A8H7N577_BIOOC